MNITVVGLGLIGASLAKSIKKNTNHTVFGIDKDKNVADKAVADNAIDHIGGKELLSNSDLTIVSLYPAAAVKYIKDNADNFKKGSVVIDTCGTKRNICRELVDFSHKHGFEFIGAHPMAGKEKFGYDNSESTLFDNAYMILTPIDADGDNIEMLKNLSKELKFKGVTISTPSEHDRIIAYTSQIPHVLACAYISDPDALLHDGFSAGSYKDISRVADINSALWQELFLDNKDYLMGHIDVLIDNLSRIKSLVNDGNSDELTALLQNAKETKNRIG